MKSASEMNDPIQRAIAQETALLIANDALRYPAPGTKVHGSSPRPLETFTDSALAQARQFLDLETSPQDLSQYISAFETAWLDLHSSSTFLDDKAEDPNTAHTLHTALLTTADQNNKLEKKLALHLGGYQQRAKTLRAKIGEAAEALEKAKGELEGFRNLAVEEDGAVGRRVEGLRGEAAGVRRREGELQGVFRGVRGEWEGVNGMGGEWNGW